MRFLHGAEAVTAVHDDGFATWKVTPAWNEGHAAHGVKVLDFAAATPAAHAALWHTMLSIDLVGTITSSIHPIDDARCRKARRRADVVTDEAGAGALLLGGITTSQLVAGRRAEVRDEATRRRADAFFATSPLPHSTTAF